MENQIAESDPSGTQKVKKSNPTKKISPKIKTVSMFVSTLYPEWIVFYL